jgi:hypothetical protein
MQSKAATVAEYLASLPEGRRAAVQAVRETILANLDTAGGYEEGMTYGMIGYFVPHRIYPDGYHCDPKQPLPFVNLASQKNYISLYMMCIYGMPEHAKWFTDAWRKSGRKMPSMGKSCIRFRKLEEVPLDVIGEAIRRVPVQDLIAFYESAIKTSGKRPRSQTKAASAKKAVRQGAKESAKKTASAGGRSRKQAG